MRNFSINKRWLKWLYLVWAVLLAVGVAILLRQVLSYKPLPLLIPDPVEVSQINEPIQPIPLHLNLDAKKVGLGEKLFSDIRLSANRTVACITCHEFDTGGVDQKVRSPNYNGQLLAVNTPTVFNSAFNLKLTWSGRDDNLLVNVDASIRTMGGKWEEIVPMLQNSPDYALAFAKAYRDGVTEDNIMDAIATFEESLYTPNSRFDQFLRGNSDALTLQEKEGYNLFKDYGCISCHQGINVGGNMFQKFGVIGNYFTDRGNVTKADWGRFNVTGQEKDRYIFRVPSLRNVELTPPYFHDGTAKTLKQAIAVMAEYQLGRPLTSEQTDLIIQFLRTLTGEYQGKSLSH
jgi:cytochrome c peroxidase